MAQNRLKLSFTKEEIRSSLKLGCSGISTPMVSDDHAKQQFKVGSVMESFGLFGGSGNPNVFYPDLDVPNDIMPKAEDFIRVPFRLLSATVVGAYSWKATDFSDEKVLKASLKKLVTKPIFTEHDQEMLNWVGIVEGTSWDKQNGKVPGGINGLLAIDAKTNPKIARGVLIGAIFSNSVTVEFDWVPSHDFDDPYEFENSVGTIHPDDKKMVRRIVTKIHDFHETSLVWLGADPYAKAVDSNGNLVNIEQASTYNLEKEAVKERYKNENTYSIPFAMDKNIISLSKNKTEHNSNNNNMEKQVELELKKLIGLKDEDTLTVEHLAKLEKVNPELKAKSEAFDKLQSLNEDGEEVAKLEDISIDDFVAIDKEVAKSYVKSNKEAKEFKASIESKLELKEGEDVMSKLEQLSANSKIGIQSLEDKRAECKRLYGLSVDNKIDETIVELINEADPKRLTALVNQYSDEAVGKFTGSCKTCGGKNVEFKSSETEVSSPVESGEGIGSFADLLNTFDKPSMSLNKKNINK